MKKAFQDYLESNLELSVDLFNKWYKESNSDIFGRIDKLSPYKIKQFFESKGVSYSEKDIIKLRRKIIDSWKKNEKT